MDDVSFVAVDWGTTSFRLWALATDGSFMASCDGPFGMSQLKKDEFGVVLDADLEKLGIDKGVPVVICGMAWPARRRVGTKPRICLRRPGWTRWEEMRSRFPVGTVT